MRSSGVCRTRIDHVELAGEQGGDARRGIGNASEDNLRQVVLGLRPPIRVVDEDRLHLVLTLLEDEGAGPIGVADRVIVLALGRFGHFLGLVLLRPHLAHHVPVGHLLREDRVGAVGDDLDGEVVDLTDRLGGGEGRGDLRGARPLEGEDDVIGGERGAVVELYPLAQLEAPDVGRGLRPFRRQGGRELQLLVALDEGFVDVAHEAQQSGFLPCVGVHRDDVAVIRPAERLGRKRRGSDSQGSDQPGGKQSITHGRNLPLRCSWCRGACGGR